METFLPNFEQLCTLNKYMPAENETRNNKKPKDFCWTQSKYFHAEIWEISLENKEDNILGFQFESVSAKPTHPSYNDGSNQDESQKQPPEVF